MHNPHTFPHFSLCLRLPQIYKVLPVDIGGLHSALTVPPLLGLFYVVLGLLFVLLDERLPGPDTQKVQGRCSIHVDLGKNVFDGLCCGYSLCCWARGCLGLVYRRYRGVTADV